MLLKLYSILFVYILTVQCQRPNLIAPVPGSRVVRGEKATKDYPYQLSLQLNSEHMCGATILSENYFLTAAHCIDGQNISRLSVLAGTSNLKEASKGSRLPIDLCRVHPDYVKLNTSDIAICKTKLPFVFSEKIGKADIDRAYVGAKVNSTLTGWGSTSMFHSIIPIFSLFAYPDDLQQGFYLTMTNDDCISKGVQVDDTQICAYSQFGQGACVGDSGGPLVKDNTLVGVVSSGTIVCAIGQPDVYTRVSFFYNWIVSNMGVDSAASSANPIVQSIISNIPEILKGI